MYYQIHLYSICRGVILARLTLPGMHALSPARCLIISNGNGQRIFIVSIQILQEGIRGIHFL